MNFRNRLKKYRLRSEGEREFINGALVGLCVKLLAAFSSFGMSVSVARVGGAEQAGIFFFGFAILMILSAVSRLGLDKTVVRFVAASVASNDSDQVSSVERIAIKWVASTSVVLAVLAASASFLGRQWGGDSLFFGTATILMIAALPYVALFTTYACLLQGMKSILKSLLVLSVVAPLIFMLLILLLKPDLAIGMSLAYFISTVICLIMGRWWWRKSLPQEKVGVSAKYLLLRKKMWDSCKPLWVVGVINQLNLWFPQILLGIFYGSENVAFYAAAHRVSLLTTFFLIAINSISGPQFADIYARGDLVELRRRALLAVRFALFGALPAVFVLILFSKQVMGIFGDGFSSASAVLVVLSLGQLVNVATGSVGQLLTMSGNEKLVRFNAFVAFVVSIICCVTLVPIMGVMGAAIATALAVSLQNLLSVFQIKKSLGFNLLKFW